MQAQGCPVVRLGRVHVDWLDKASFGPGYEPGSRTSGGFRIPVSLDGPLDGITGALSGGSRAPGVVEGDACTRRRLNTRVAKTALHALRRLSTIASALGHQEERIPDDVSTRGDVDACSRASRASID